MNDSPNIEEATARLKVMEPDKAACANSGDGTPSDSKDNQRGLPCMPGWVWASTPVKPSKRPEERVNSSKHSADDKRRLPNTSGFDWSTPVKRPLKEPEEMGSSKRLADNTRKLRSIGGFDWSTPVERPLKEPEERMESSKHSADDKRRLPHIGGSDFDFRPATTSPEKVVPLFDFAATTTKKVVKSTPARFHDNLSETVVPRFDFTRTTKEDTTGRPTAANNAAPKVCTCVCVCGAKRRDNK